VEKDTERDYFMSAEDARQYGIIDEVVVKQGVPAANRT
jgi:ATP-dependent Clp protease protease subunit